MKLLSFLSLLLFSPTLYSQITANSTMGLPTGTTSEITALITANLGSIAYSTDDDIILQYNGTAWVAIGDNLGNHIATENIQLNSNFISGDGDDEGISINTDGQVGISNLTGFVAERQLHVAGTNGGIRLDRYGNDSFLFLANLNLAGNTVLQNWAFINNSSGGGNNDFEIRNYGTDVEGPGIFTPFRLKTNNQLQLEGYNLAANEFNDNAVTKILGVQDNGDVVKVDRSSLGSSNAIVYEKIVIWAEEAANLQSNSLEWSFGNNAIGQIGIPLPENWEAYAVSFNADISDAGSTAEIAVINSATDTNLFTFTASGAVNNIVFTEILATPVAIPAGTSIGFRTVLETGQIRDARVAVFLRRIP